MTKVQYGKSRKVSSRVPLNLDTRVREKADMLKLLGYNVSTSTILCMAVDIGLDRVERVFVGERGQGEQQHTVDD